MDPHRVMQELAIKAQAQESALKIIKSQMKNGQSIQHPLDSLTEISEWMNMAVGRHAAAQPAPAPPAAEETPPDHK